MKIPAMSMSSPLAGRVERDGAELLHDVQCEAVVHVEQAYLAHHGPDQNYRPYLRLAGEMRSLVPDHVLPADVDELTSRPALGPLFDGFYEFDDDQLTQMVSKGYFSPAFRTPEIMTGVDYELPVTANVLILHPQAEGDVPVVFVDVHNRNDMVLDLESTGYDLAEYFENVRVKQDEVQAQAEGEHTREVDDIFEDERFREMHVREEEMMAEKRTGRWVDEESRNAARPVVEEQEDSLLPPADERGIEEAPEQSDGVAPMSLTELYEQVINPYVEEQVTAPKASEAKPVASVQGGAEADDPGVEVPEDHALAPVFADDELEVDEDEIDLSDFEDDEEPGPKPISTGDAAPANPQRSAPPFEEDETEQDSRESGLGG